MDFITTNQSTGEIHISLNSKKQQEIYDFIKGEEWKQYQYSVAQEA